jgi:putative DNA methylase
MERRFIEESFPIKEVSKESSREKRIHHGHISSMHMWWARRPVATSRVSAYAALISNSKDEKNRNVQNEFLIKLSKWENSSNQDILKEARKYIKKTNSDIIRVLDPFSGGGSIPLECAKLGFETFASDINPVATLLLKCTIEYPQKYCLNTNLDTKKEIENEFDLLSQVTKWKKWVKEEVNKEIGIYYNPTEKGITDNAYIWTKTVPCQNPKCGKNIPLLKQFWLANKKNKKIALMPYIQNNNLKFKIVGTDHEKIPSTFDPKKGNVSRANATCFICNSSIDGKTLRKLFQTKKSSSYMLAVMYKEGKSSKKYRMINDNDKKNFQKAEKYLIKKIKQLEKEWGMNPIPDEIIFTPNNQEYEPGNVLYNFTPVMLYGLTKWGDLFNARQKLALVTLSEKIRNAYQEMLKDGITKEYAIAITTYLALGVDRIADRNSILSVWNNLAEKQEHTFGRQALPMVLDYAETNVVNGSQGWDKQFEYILAALKNLVIPSSNQVHISQSSAMNLQHENEFFDAIFTDPPYYDNIPYSVLSDYFYVWLKRTVGHLYPEIFVTPLSPKTDEAISEIPLIRGMDKDKALLEFPNIKSKKDFENMLSKSFKEMYRVLKKDGIVVIVYAHKSTEGWETLINSILNSGLVVTAAWPLDTEMKGRLRDQESAALSSSIYMVCRKWKKEPIGFYRDVKKELKLYLDKKLEQLWNEGISGADFFISAIGSAIEVYGKYEKVIDDSDEQISVLKLLDDTRNIVTNYAINKVIKGEFSDEIFQMTRFYILWRWAYGESKVSFDGARKMAQSVGIDLEHEWNKGFIVKDKEFIRVLGPDERTEKELSDPQDLIDILHKTLQIWKKGKMNEVDKFLEEKGYKNSDVFSRVAQAISESLPLESTEKKWLDGFLTGFKSDGSKSEVQSKLF